MTNSIDTWEMFSKERKTKNETNDCTVRALATIKDISYDEAHKIMADKGERQNRKGCLSFMTSIAYESQGLQKTEMWKEKPTFAKFIKNNPNFTGVIGVKGHVFTMKQGVVYGNWNDDKRTRARVLKTYTLAKKGQIVLTHELKFANNKRTIQRERVNLKKGKVVQILDTYYRIQDDNKTIGIVKNGETEIVDLAVGMKRFYAAQQRRARKGKKAQQQNA